MLVRVTTDWPDAVQVLLDSGAPVDSRDQYGETPLMWCAMRHLPSSLSTARLLIQRGAWIEARDSRGNMAENYAIESNDMPLVRLLRTARASRCASSSVGVWETISKRPE